MHESSETLKTLTEPNTQEELFSLQPASLANLPLLPGSERAQKMTVGSGRKLLGFYLNLKQNAPSLKTLSEYLLLKKDWYSRICFLKWKVRGTKYNRILYQLQQLEPSIEGTESGLLPTPSASEDGRTSKEGWTWNKTHWLDETGKKIQTHLKHTVQMLGTPKATQSLRSKNFREGIGDYSGQKLQLMPAFEEWMFHLPMGYTRLKKIEPQDSKPSETQSNGT